MSSSLAQRTTTRTRSARLATRPYTTHSRSSSSATASTAPSSTTRQVQHRNTSGTTRSRISEEQRIELRRLYDEEQNPTIKEREEISARMGISPSRVTNWFRNMRQQDRRAGLERQRTIEEEDEIDDDDDEEEDEDEEDEPEEVFTPEPQHTSPPATHGSSLPTSPSIVPLPPITPKASPSSLYKDHALIEDAKLLLHFSQRLQAMVNHPISP